MIPLGIITAAALLLLAMLMRGTGEATVLALLAILAMIGVFFLFGMAAGLVRFNDRDGDDALAANVTDQLPDAIHITSKSGTTLYANDAYRSLVGEAVAGQMADLEPTFATFPKSAEALFRLSRAAERGESAEEIFQISSPAGTPSAPGTNVTSAPGTNIQANLKWYRISVTPLAQAEGHSGDNSSILWKIADVTLVQENAAHTMQKLEHELQLFEDLPVGLLTFTKDGKIVKLNRTLADWLAVDEPHDLEQYRKLSDLVRGHDAALMQMLIQEGDLSQEHPVTTDLDDDSDCCLDVELLSAQSNLIPVRLLSGGLVAHSADSQNDAVAQYTVVVQKRTDEANDTAIGVDGDSGLARFLDNAPFGIATVDAAGRIISSNKPFARMVGVGRIARRATIAKLLNKGSKTDAHTSLMAALDQISKGESMVEPVDITLGTKSEQTRRIFVTPFRRDSDANECAILYVVDTTEQKALELQFAQSQKMEAVGKLAGGIAHDFNNVLTVIIGLSDLFLQTRRPTDAGYNDIMQIKSNAKRVAGTVRHLLAFSRKQTLSADVIMLNDVVQDLGYTLSRLLGERVELKVNCQRDLWYVKADTSKFEQVVINLAVNARDAMPEGGRLTIRTKNVTERDSLKLTDQGVVRGEYVLIEVKDTGTGMSEDVVEKIFEPFYTTKAVGKGTGLGLASVYGFVKQTGGYVYADSKLGKGSTFRVYLPRYQGEILTQDLNSNAKSESSEQPRDLTGTGRVLLVEDEDGVRSFATRALKRQGYEVLEAASGVEALEVLEQFDGTIDLVVSDVVMPEMDGPSLLKELRKTHKDLKFVFMSGYPDDAFAKTLDENEVYGFLAKPFTLPQLAAKVKEELTS